MSQPLFQTVIEYVELSKEEQNLLFEKRCAKIATAVPNRLCGTYVGAQGIAP